MDLSNTAVRWINLDSQSTKKSEQAPGLGAEKTAKTAFRDNLASLKQGQQLAGGGNTLPSEDEQAEAIEIRLLTTEPNRAAPNSGARSGGQAPLPAPGQQGLHGNAIQADLIYEISAFNKDTSAHDHASSTHSVNEATTTLTEVTVSLEATHSPSTSPVKSTDKPATSATTSLVTGTVETPTTATGAAQQTVVAHVDTPSPELPSTQASPVTQQRASDASSKAPEFKTTVQTAQTVNSKLNNTLKAKPTQNSLTTTAIALNPAASTASASTPQAANPLKAEILLVATQTADQQVLKTSKLGKTAAATSLGQDLKLVDSTNKQAAVKLVMIEASATLQQWQKLKQLDNDTTDSSAEPLSTLQSSEARALRASPELQAARLVKTEQDAQALSQKFAEQLGQRLIQNVQKGHWRAELELHPKSLGRIDVQLDFVNGQLEGHFQTHNPHTRELLQEGLPRLREWLQQTGTQVANLEVNNGNTGQGGEKPTPQMLPGRQNDAVTDEPGAELASQAAKTQGLKEGFDLLV